MKHRLLAILVLALLVSLMSVAEALPAGPHQIAAPFACVAPPPGSTPESQAQALLAAVNQFRAANGLPPAAWNQLLANAALAHSQDMSQNDFFSHRGSDGSNFQQRIVRAGYIYSWAGENLAVGYSEATAVVEVWRQSPPHLYVLVNPGLHEVGIGYVHAPNDQANVRLDDGQLAGPFCFYWTLNGGYRAASTLPHRSYLPLPTR